MATLTCPSVDLNFLSPNGFMLSIDRTPKVSFYTQEVNLPGLSIASLDTPTALSSISIPSDKLNFEPLVFTFIVDEQMENWLELFRWMRGLGHPESYEQYTTENNRSFRQMAELERNYSDVTLQVLGSNNLPVRTFRFVDCFPTSIGGITFNSTNTDVQYATATVTLEYSYFKLD